MTTLKLDGTVVATADAAALGMGTTIDCEVIHANSSVLPNDTLAHVMHENSSRGGGFTCSDADKAFAKEIAKTLPKGAHIDGRPIGVKPIEAGERSNSSTDVGDVSWTVPNRGHERGDVGSWDGRTHLVNGSGGQDAYWSQRHVSGGQGNGAHCSHPFKNQAF